MKTPRLTASQAAAFNEHIRPMLRFLFRCRKRLDDRGFDPKCTLYQTVNKAYDSIQHLFIELHYESCGHGTGRPPTDDSPPSESSE